jgi:hypothetical protein
MDDPVLDRWLDEVRDVVFRYPRGMRPTNAAPCRGCRQLVLWVITEAGKKMPVDAKGTSHFATCPQADRFRRRGVPEEPDMPPWFAGIDLTR